MSPALLSDLESCYQELLEGQTIEKLLRKYVRIEVLVAQQLFARGMTSEELHKFRERQAASIAFAYSNGPKPSSCSCGLMLFDDEEYRKHVRLNPDPSRESILQEREFHIARRYGR